MRCGHSCPSSRRKPGSPWRFAPRPCGAVVTVLVLHQIPAFAGMTIEGVLVLHEIPAYAGMTIEGGCRALRAPQQLLHPAGGLPQALLVLDQRDPDEAFAF